MPVPGRTEATVGPSLSPGGMYTVAKGPTALLQKTRRGESDLPKRLSRVAKKELKGFLNVIDLCRIALEVLSVATNNKAGLTHIRGFLIS